MNHFEVYKDSAGQYRWRLVASNNQIIAWSEGYSTKQNAMYSAQWTKSNASSATIRDLA